MHAYKNTPRTTFATKKWAKGDTEKHPERQKGTLQEGVREKYAKMNKTMGPLGPSKSLILHGKYCQITVSNI